MKEWIAFYGGLGRSRQPDWHLDNLYIWKEKILVTSEGVACMVLLIMINDALSQKMGFNPISLCRQGIPQDSDPTIYEGIQNIH